MEQRIGSKTACCSLTTPVLWNCLDNTPTEDGGEPGRLDGRLTLNSVREVVKEALD